jgi:hypothetical protein
VGKRTLENPDSGGKVVDTPGSFESGGDDRRRGDEIVGEAVVQVSLCGVSRVGSIAARPLIQWISGNVGAPHLDHNKRT